MPEFASPWDEALAASGLPALFTLDPEGKLRVDPERTREIYLLGPVEGPGELGHYVLTDARTRLRLYLFVTHPVLAERQPRGTVVRHPDAGSAIAEAVEQWAVPAPQPAES
jgi:hypothetical protein